MRLISAYSVPGKCWQLRRGLWLDNSGTGNGVNMSNGYWEKIFAKIRQVCQYYKLLKFNISVFCVQR